jgi:hypothetical protein
MQIENPEPSSADSSRMVALTALLAEVSAETRSRRDPEYLYTAASVGAFGAVAWGVAALTTGREAWSPAHPALIAAVGILAIAFAVVVKVVREHRLYVGLRREQVRVAKLLTATAGFQEGILPPGLKASGDGPGHWFSVAIVLVAAVSTSGFCFAIWAGR